MNHCGQRAQLCPCHLPGIDPAFDPTLSLPDKDLACEVCKFPTDWACMMLCDACGNGYRLYCLQPPLEHVPVEDWVCPVWTAEQVTLPHVQAVRSTEQSREAERAAIAGPTEAEKTANANHGGRARAT